MVKAADPGIDIFVRNKRPAVDDLVSPGADRVVRARRDLSRPHRVRYEARWPVVDGISSPRAATTSGSSTFAVMASPPGRPRCRSRPEANPPIVRGETAVKDIGSVVDFILAAPQHRAPQPARPFVGLDADGDLHHAERREGRTACSLRAALDSANVPRLFRPGPASSAAYRTVHREQALERWMTGVPRGQESCAHPRRLVRRLG